MKDVEFGKEEWIREKLWYEGWAQGKKVNKGRELISLSY